MKYFTFEELSHSDTAVKKGIRNVPTAEAQANLKALVDRILDPLREVYGKPIYVNSGYRSPELNKALGSASKTSQHMTGHAADITAGSRAENKRLFTLIQTLDLPYDQLIFESGNLAEGPDWVHVSFDPKRNRRERLRWDGKNYIRM